MEARALASTFIDRFCAGDLEGLEPLLAERLRFNGPFLSFETRETYLQALRQDPPVPGEHRLRCVLEGGDRIAVFWDWGKGLDFVPMAQLFRVADGRICEILLVFDSAALIGPPLAEMEEAEE